MTKILLVFTGGTIGSSAGEGSKTSGGPVICLDEGAPSLLLEMYAEASGHSKTASAEDAVSFDIIKPYTILSEDLSAKEINLLIQTVREALGRDYDGIIVTHGSDTLQFSAAALALALGSDTAPVMVTASDRPLADPAANGLANFCAAVDFIREKKGKGTFIPWRNVPDSPVIIHKALEAMSWLETTGKLESSGQSIPEPYAAHPDIHFPESSGILVLSACPGAVYDLPPLSSADCRLILLRPYHSGTLPTGDEAFRRFCLKASEAGIPIYVSGCHEGAVYETALAYSELGIRVLPFSAFPADYMRLWAGLV